MVHLKNLTKVVLLGCVTLFATAQNPLHQQEHEKYIAGIQNGSKKIQNDVANQLIQKHLGEEDLDITITDVSYKHGWDNPRVNCFLDVEIPQTARLDVRGFQMPVEGRVTSGYGYRPRFRRMHRGVDLSLSVGDTVRAAFDGCIRIVGNEPNGYGKYVVIRHDNGVETVYGHFSKHLVAKDKMVKAGEPIGLGGSTGRSTGPHLHFEFRYLGLAVNPASVIDFANGVVIKDVYTFDKRSYQQASNVVPKGKSYSTKQYKKKTYTASKKTTKQSKKKKKKS